MVIKCPWISSKFGYGSHVVYAVQVVSEQKNIKFQEVYKLVAF